MVSLFPKAGIPLGWEWVKKVSCGEEAVGVVRSQIVKGFMRHVEMLKEDLLKSEEGQLGRISWRLLP